MSKKNFILGLVMGILILIGLLYAVYEDRQSESKGTNSTVLVSAW